MGPGASDGIGKSTNSCHLKTKFSVALELLVQGFNVVIHGRNQEKLQRVRAKLTSHPERSISVFV